MPISIIHLQWCLGCKLDAFHLHAVLSVTVYALPISIIHLQWCLGCKLDAFHLQDSHRSAVNAPDDISQLLC